MKPVYTIKASGDPSVRAVAPAVNENAHALAELQETVARLEAEVERLRKLVDPPTIDAVMSRVSR